MIWTVTVDKNVPKALKRFPKPDTEQIRSAIRLLATNPYSGDIEKMQGETDVWRRRIGTYRIFYQVIQNQRIVYVYSVKRRTSVTYYRISA